MLRGFREDQRRLPVRSAVHRVRSSGETVTVHRMEFSKVKTAALDAIRDTTSIVGMPPGIESAVPPEILRLLIMTCYTWLQTLFPGDQWDRQWLCCLARRECR